jgi:ubiquinone/menaquinone biosynthesis C-methylase UbiE
VSPHPWDRAAQGWQQHGKIIRTWLDQATIAMLDGAHISTGMSVLDIGAGAGDQTLDIAARVGTNGYVLATDISPAILDLARHNAALHAYPQIATQVVDAQSLNLAGAQFDAAVSRMGLMFCERPVQAFEHARRALKPGGHFAALVFSQPSTNPCLTITLNCARQHAGITTHKAFSEDDAYQPGGLMSLGKPGRLKDLLLQAGFLQCEVRPVSAPMALGSVQHYIAFLRSAASPIIELLAKLSPVAQEAAWCDMAEQLEIYQHECGWIGPNELLLCAAQAPC